MSDARVLVETPRGRIVIGVDLRAAPLTAAHFLEFVARGHLAQGSGVYRIVARHNCERPPAIDVVQFGWLPTSREATPPLPPVPHESTRRTGLRHVDGTISLARVEPGSGTSAFFLCVGDQPALDHGGARAADGEGFAAFGRVEEGRDVLVALHGLAGPSEWLAEPLPIGGCLLAAGESARPRG